MVLFYIKVLSKGISLCPLRQLRPEIGESLVIFLNCSIDMYNLKGFYPYNHKNLTCLVYDEGSFKNK